MKTDLYIELNGHQTDYKLLVDTAKEIWKAEGNKVKDMENLEMYFKPDERTCYFVINGEAKGSFEL